MIDVKDKVVTRKLQTALDKYPKDSDKQKRFALYIMMAGKELDDVDEVIQLAEEAMTENDKETTTNREGGPCQIGTDGFCVNCGGEGGTMGPCKTGVKEKDKVDKKPAKLPDATPIEAEPSEKAKRAKAAYHAINEAEQNYAEEGNEAMISKILQGHALPDSEPVDSVAGFEGAKGHGVELKTMLDNKGNKLTMDSYAQIRKINWERENKTVFHTIVVDDQKVYNAMGEGKHDESKRIFYYRRGIAGSARIEAMHKVGSEEELKKLMTMDEGKLPKQAKRTDGDKRVGEWVPITHPDDPKRKGFRNTETGDEHFAKPPKKKKK